MIETQGAPDAQAVEQVLVLTEAVTRELQHQVERGRVLSVTSPAPLLPSRSTQTKRFEAWMNLPRERAARNLRGALESNGFRVAAFAPALRLLENIPEPIDPTKTAMPGIEILVERHVERDETGLSVLVSFSPRDVVALEEVADLLAARLDVPPGISLRTTGRPLMEAELQRMARRELVSFVGIVVIALGVLIGLRERRLGSTLAQLFVPVASVIAVLGVAGLFGIALTPVSLVVLPLTVGIGLDDCLFLVERYRETSNVEEAVARGGRALSVTTATTMAGFGVLAFSRYPALSGLGSLAALSIAICFLATLCLLPVVLSPGRLRKQGSDGGPG